MSQHTTRTSSRGGTYGDLGSEDMTTTSHSSETRPGGYGGYALSKHIDEEHSPKQTSSINSQNPSVSSNTSHGSYPPHPQRAHPNSRFVETFPENENPHGIRDPQHSDHHSDDIPMELMNHTVEGPRTSAPDKVHLTPPRVCQSTFDVESQRYGTSVASQKRRCKLLTHKIAIIIIVIVGLATMGGALWSLVQGHLNAQARAKESE